MLAQKKYNSSSGRKPMKMRTGRNTKGLTTTAVFALVIVAIIGGRALAETYDDFEGGQIDPTLWETHHAGEVLSQSDGYLNADAPPYLSWGWIWSKVAFYGDFEAVLDWRDFSVSDPGDLTTYHEFGLNVIDSTDTDNSQAYIVRGYGSGPVGWILSNIRKDGVSLDFHGVSDVSASAGLFKITRTGSTINTYYNIGGGWVTCGTATGGFTGPVLLHIHGQTANAGLWHVSSDWITIEGTVSVPDLLAMTEADAEAALTANVLVKGAVSHEYSDTVNAGLVITQNPNPGTLLDCGSAVDLVISDGPSSRNSIEVDIKPGSCPNQLNIKSNGLLPVAILGSQSLDVWTVNPASIRLEGVAPVRSSYEDVARPVRNKTNECDCTTEGSDGHLDLVLKFNTQDVVNALGQFNEGDTLLLTLTGENLSGTSIEGTDCVAIVGKNSK